MCYKLENYLNHISTILDELYEQESDLFEHDLCERCIMFRFAYRLQKLYEWTYFVDCEYNKAFKPDENGNYNESSLKWITQPDWTVSNKYIDIIVRDKRVPSNSYTDIICFELKKEWNSEWRDKDKINLEQLTSNKEGFWYGYQYWFALTFWKKRDSCVCDIYKWWEILKNFTFN